MYISQLQKLKPVSADFETEEEGEKEEGEGEEGKLQAKLDETRRTYEQTQDWDEEEEDADGETRKDEGSEKATRRQQHDEHKQVVRKTQELSQKFGTIRATGKLERLVRFFKFNALLYICGFNRMCAQCRSRSVGTSVPLHLNLLCYIVGQK
jgi:hypothetical protein